MERELWKQLYAMVVRLDNLWTNGLPIFVYESELKEFWNDLSFGIELTETSKLTCEENRLPLIE